MAVIANLDIVMGARTQGVTRGIQQTQSQVGSMVKALAATAAAGLTLHTVLGRISSAMDDIDRQAKSAAKLGMTFNELGGLQFAAQEMTGDPETITRAMRDMQRNAANAVSGDTTLQNAFRRLGVDAGQAMQQGATQNLAQLADAFAGIESHAERIQLAMRIFGRQGAEILPLLMAGSEAIKEAAEFQEKWAGLTQEQAKAVEANNDAWGRVRVVMDGIVNRGTAELAPLLNNIANDVLGTATGFGDISKSIGDSVELLAGFYGMMKDIWELGQLFTLQGALRAIADPRAFAAEINTALTFDQAEAEILRLLERRKELAAQAAQPPQAPPEIDQQAMANARAVESRLSSQQQELTVLQQVLGLSEQIGAAALDQLATLRQRQELIDQGATDEQLAEFDSAAAQIQELERRNELLREGQRLTDQITADLATPVEQMQAELDHLWELFEAGAITFDTLAAAAEAAAERIHKAQKEVEESEAPQSGGAAVERGSVEAMAAILRARQAEQTKPVEKTNMLLTEVRQVLVNTQASIENLEAIGNAG